MVVTLPEIDIFNTKCNSDVKSVTVMPAILVNQFRFCWYILLNEFGQLNLFRSWNIDVLQSDVTISSSSINKDNL